MTSVWDWPVTHRGRRTGEDLGHAQWRTRLAQGWWVQIDPEDGPIFCRWIPQSHKQGRTRLGWRQVILGPEGWSGVWEVAGHRAALQVTVTPAGIPQIHYRRGNCAPVADWQADVTPDLRAVLLREGLCTAKDWDRFTGDRATRERAARHCRPLIWM